MSDNRRRNNQSVAQRRASVYNRRKKTAAARKIDLLATAKSVLRRSGRVVYEARIDEPRFAGTVVIDARRLPRGAVIEMAETLLLRETLRNNELRTQHGLAALPHKSLKELAEEGKAR